jgi:hypothetical protein
VEAEQEALEPGLLVLPTLVAVAAVQKEAVGRIPAAMADQALSLSATQDLRKPRAAL